MTETEFAESRPLSIGTIIGGANSSNRAWLDAISDVARRVSALRIGVAWPLYVNVIFQIPGARPSARFPRGAYRSYSKKLGWLIVQVAVPADVPLHAGARVQELLFEAIDEAEAWARRRKIAPDLRAVRGILDRMAVA